MHSRFASAIVPALVLISAAALLAGCSDDDDGDGDGGSSLQQALGTVPAGSTQVEFRDAAAYADRLGLDDDATADDYLDAITSDDLDDVQTIGGSTQLAPYVDLMSDGGSVVDELAVQWELNATIDDDRATVYRVDDDVDLDALVDDLVDRGLTESELRGRRRAFGELDDVVDLDTTIDGVYPQQFRETTIDTDRHLVVLGPGAEAVLETLDGDRDSLEEAGTFDDVLRGVDDVELASLGIGEYVCFASDAVRDPRTNIPDEVLAQYDDLGRPEITAALLHGDDPDLSMRLEFADDDMAESDLDARRAYLDDGISAATREPLADSYSADLERRGTVVVADVRGDLRTAIQSLRAPSDGPLTCGEA